MYHYREDVTVSPERQVPSPSLATFIEPKEGTNMTIELADETKYLSEFMASKKEIPDTEPIVHADESAPDDDGADEEGDEPGDDEVREGEEDPDGDGDDDDDGDHEGDHEGDDPPAPGRAP